jgi:hypothetical protein
VCATRASERGVGDVETPRVSRHRIGKARPDDWNRPSGLLRGTGVQARGYDDDVNVEMNQLTRERGEPLISALGRSLLDRYVLAVDVAEFAQSFDERSPQLRTLGVGSWDISENADSGEVPRLRLSGERCSEHSSQASDEDAAVHRFNLRLLRHVQGVSLIDAV